MGQNNSGKDLQKPLEYPHWSNTRHYSPATLYEYDTRK